VRRFEDRVALVTGAGGGIGASVAQALAAEGAAVALFDVDRAALERTHAALEGGGARAIVLTGDVRSDEDVRRTISDTVAAFGGLHLLANMAGVIRYGNAPEFSEDDWDLVLDTNAKGVYLCSRYAVPHLRAGGGAIVNAASVLAFVGEPDTFAYCASKAAVVALTTAMALDHAHERIRINCIAPGSVRTAMLDFGISRTSPDDPDAARLAAGEQHPIGRLIEPEEVANLVLFLLSDEASAITGSCHRVDGGLISKLGN